MRDSLLDKEYVTTNALERPELSMTRNPFFFGFLVIFALIFVFTIMQIIRVHKIQGRILNKALGDGHKKATKGQMRLIADMYRELGIFAEPEEDMTREEARELLDELRKQLKTKRGHQ